MTCERYFVVEAVSAQEATLCALPPVYVDDGPERTSGQREGGEVMPWYIVRCTVVHSRYYAVRARSKAAAEAEDVAAAWREVSAWLSRQ